MSVKGDRGAEREVPAGGARNSAVLGKEDGPDGESDRAIVARKPGNSGGAQGPAFRHASEAEEDQAIEMSLTTPEKIRNLQKKLYLKAKQEPNFRFYQLPLVQATTRSGAATFSSTPTGWRRPTAARLDWTA